MRTIKDRHAHIDRIAKCLEIVAQCVEFNPEFTPIFERLDAELSAEVAGVGAVNRVRARIRLGKMATA